MSVHDEIKRGHSRIFRKCYVKRRLGSDGTFESEWQDVSSDVKKWGSYKQQLDPIQPNKFTFGNASIVFANDEGLYNPETDETSLWFNHLSQQRTLVKIEAGFLDQALGSNGIWTNSYFPEETLWDQSLWDADSSVFDNVSIMFTGLIAGDISLSNKNEVRFQVKPLTQLFQDYAAANLTGWSATGVTASQFCGMIRDHTDGSSNFVFRPFFGDTTSNWDISTTTNVFTNLNTSTAKDVVDSSIWDVMQKLAEVENFVPYVTRGGVFKFVSRDPNTTTSMFEFHGGGSFNTEYGSTIKSISSYGKKLSKYYSRVQVKWAEENTSTSYEAVQSSMQVGPTNNPWNLGERSLNLTNLYIPDASTAQDIALALFTEYSALKNEIVFSTSFIPHLEILDRVSVTYESPATNPRSLWDQADWAEDDTSQSADLIFDVSSGDAIRLQNTPFKFLSIDINLDKMETKFIAREL